MDELHRFSDEELNILAWDVFREFSDIADFVWKIPRFLTQEEQIEKEKIVAIAREDRKTAAIRWALESKKLYELFPSLVSASSFLSSASLFEHFLLKLAYFLQHRLGIAIDKSKGEGRTKLFNYLKTCGINYHSLALYEPVMSAMTIRNCLIHTGGILSWSRDQGRIREILLSQKYLTSEARRKVGQQQKPFKYAEVTDGELGEQLRITSDYSYIATIYFRDFYMKICREVDELLRLNSKGQSAGEDLS